MYLTFQYVTVSTSILASESMQLGMVCYVWCTMLYIV